MKTLDNLLRCYIKVVRSRCYQNHVRNKFSLEKINSIQALSKQNKVLVP